MQMSSSWLWSYWSCSGLQCPLSVQQQSLAGTAMWHAVLILKLHLCAPVMSLVRHVGQRHLPAQQLQLLWCCKGLEVGCVSRVSPSLQAVVMRNAFPGCALGMQAVGVLHPVYDIHRIAEQPGQHLEVSALLLDMVKLPNQRAQLMEEMIKAFVFAIPKVSRVHCCAFTASAQCRHAG